MGHPQRSDADALAGRWIDAWLGRASFAACCTGVVSYEDPLASRPTSGIASLEAHAARLREAFPDARLEATAPALGDGRHACIPWRVAGTQRGPIATLPATNRPLALHGLHYVELADGLVRRARGFFDLYDGATQLGLLPARGGLGESALMMLRGFGLRR